MRAIHMQDFEKPRFESAIQGFVAAFDKGFEKGKQLLAEGKVEQLADIDSVFKVEVLRDNILDNEWPAHAHKFEVAGIQAAQAKRRKGEAKLMPDPEEDFMKRTFVWTVVLNP